MDEKIRHLPVLLEEIVESLNLKQDGIYIDATVGLGGHAAYIVKEIGPGGTLFGIDRDEEALGLAEKRLSDKRVVLRRGSFSDMESLLYTEGVSEADGILFDLGLSMLQVKNPERGFSFLSGERLDMRMDRRQKISAWTVVNKYPEKELVRILKTYGEERLSGKIAKAVLRQRGKKTIDTCSELSEIVEGVYGGRGKIHPADREPGSRSR